MQKGIEKLILNQKHKRKFMYSIIISISILFLGYKFSYPYKSYEECFHQEIKDGGTEQSSESFCLSEDENQNFRRFELNPFRNDFILYDLYRGTFLQNPEDQSDMTLNEEIATEGTANDTMTVEDALGAASDSAMGVR